SYAITAENVGRVAGRVVIEAANSATTPDAEAVLTARGVPVIPDFVANAGAVAWAWWVLLGWVGTDPEDSFQRLRTEMLTKITLLVERWALDHVPPRQTARELAATNHGVTTSRTVTIP